MGLELQINRQVFYQFLRAPHHLIQQTWSYELCDELILTAGDSRTQFTPSVIISIWHQVLYLAMNYLTIFRQLLQSGNVDNSYGTSGAGPYSKEFMDQI